MGRLPGGREAHGKGAATPKGRANGKVNVEAATCPRSSLNGSAEFQAYAGFLTLSPILCTSVGVDHGAYAGQKSRLEGDTSADRASCQALLQSRQPLHINRSRVAR